MTLSASDTAALRSTVSSWPAEASSDAHGIQAASEEEFYAPASHAAALDPRSPIVRGARGTGKSFWASVLNNENLRAHAAKAYPRLGLDRVSVAFGFTGLPGPDGIDKEKLDACVGPNGTEEDARRFWWATVLRAIQVAKGKPPRSPKEFMALATSVEKREALLSEHEHPKGAAPNKLLIVYDALDTVAIDWPRRRMVTQALFEVVWAMRAYSTIRPKLFLRPDQLDDDALTFVEIPKLRTGAVRLTWSNTDLYALLFARLALGEARQAFFKLLIDLRIPQPTPEQVLSRDWIVLRDETTQRQLMTALAGPHMAAGPHGHKKGSTYDWPLNHLGDAFGEVTPRSFLALLTAAAQREPAPVEGIFKPDGLRHGLRLASKMRVDQLHLEFKWIKGVLAPLAGLLLPKEEKDVLTVWKRAKTVSAVLEDAQTHGYLPPFPSNPRPSERDLVTALQSIGVMSRRPDDRIDMPDLFRVAAKLLKKGGTAPL
jgi:hypothetical protein